MRDFNADIIDRLVAETWRNLAEMTVNVVLFDAKAAERYYFVFGWETPPLVAVAYARASLANQWSPQ